MTEAATERRRVRWGVWLLGVYVVLLAASHAVRLANPVDAEPWPNIPYVYLRAVEADRTLDRPVRMAYREFPPETEARLPPDRAAPSRYPS